MNCNFENQSMNREVNDAVAIRQNGVVYVAIAGTLPTPCHEAKIADKFPGGIIRYIRDPGTAEVFLTIGLKPQNEGKLCPQVIVPFLLETEIPDGWHHELTIYINRQTYKTIKIADKPEEDTSDHKDTGKPKLAFW
ncbi:hypothetical protein [Inconstantimicrobium mannanitabidum]|uniref:Uncharacterized protein n=1 Tax=Inconstantimicrobium mannanitabidum TaxID=1604901 RepID=A0ACB5RF63_9CLOT|nr:hypothetical protein [Clostridium sp. TW13]GKX67441.1 hypothetical protein rsdtw13_26990 [Clostridium sp. TW13]